MQVPVNDADKSLVDLIIPVYNEAHVLEHSVDRLAAAMADCRELLWRIVVVDNGSTDATETVGRRLAEELGHLRFLHLAPKGRGRALRIAISQTDAQFAVYMDVDLSTDLAAVPAAVELLRRGADIVAGSRLHPDSRVTRCLRREILSRGYNRLVRGVMRVSSFDDAQCGFKGFRLAPVRALLPLVKDQNWFFDTELLVLAEYAGLKICTLPIVWVEDADSRVNIPRTICEDLAGLARLRRTAAALVRQWRKQSRQE